MSVLTPLVHAGPECGTCAVRRPLMHYFSASLASITVAVALSACAHDAAASPPAHDAASARKRAAAEAAEQEAARQHPIAQPEPRSAYPEQPPPARPSRGLPEQAPPPREERGLPEQSPTPLDDGPSSRSDTGEAPAGELGPAETRVVAPEQPPLQPFAETRPPPPAVHYVWAPGYWYWYGGRYVWIDGSWVAPRAGHVYVSARWSYGHDGWHFRPGGWAVSVGGPIVHPVYPHYWYTHHHRYPHHYGHGRRHWRRDHDRRWDGSRNPRWAPSDRSVVRPDRGYTAPRSSGGRATTVRPRSSGGRANVVDVPRSSGGRTQVKARRR
jgi:hypothetical protein